MSCTLILYLEGDQSSQDEFIDGFTQLNQLCAGHQRLVQADSARRLGLSQPELDEVLKENSGYLSDYANQPLDTQGESLLNFSDPLDALSQWISAQKRHSYADYKSHYGKDFLGIKRTPSGGETRFSIEAWLKDRKRMLPKVKDVLLCQHDEQVPQAVWNAKKHRLEVHVTMTQYWRSSNFADKGPKRFILASDSCGKGSWRIVREDMLSSTTWDKRRPQGECLPCKDASCSAWNAAY